MRIFPILTAIIVGAVLYALVFERERLLGFAERTAPAATAPAAPSQTPAAQPDVTPTQEGDGALEPIAVMAMRATARDVDNAVILRGETEATRSVEVRAETSGKIISAPLRKGAFVEADQLLCEIDPGTSQVALLEAEARLSEALSRLPEAEARTREARARVPAASAGIAEAEAGVPAALAALREAEARVPAAAAALAEAEARRPETAARLLEAEARLREAEINLNAAQQLSQDGFSSQSRLAGAEAAFESARAQVETARAGLKGAESAVESAKGTLEGARAAVESARSRVEGATAAVETARAQAQSAEAGVESALSGRENALAGIEAARAAVAAAEDQIARLSIHAPFEGVLESDTAELGALMQPGAACATIIQLDPIKIVGFVPENEVERVAVGAEAGARLSGMRDVLGEVVFVSRSADPVTRTFRVEILVDNPELAIRDGQTAEIAIRADGVPAHLLPQSALTLDDDGALGVRTVAEDGTARFLPVTLLRDTLDGVLVTGLPDTVDVITVGQEFVSDGVPVAPSFQEIGQ
jgi:RND family efflux transporter MFP subunit